MSLESRALHRGTDQLLVKFDYCILHWVAERPADQGLTVRKPPPMLSAIKASSEMLYLAESAGTESIVTLMTPALSTVVVAAVSVTVSVFALEHAAIVMTAKTIRTFMYIPKEKLIIL